MLLRYCLKSVTANNQNLTPTEPLNICPDALACPTYIRQPSDTNAATEVLAP